MDCWSDIRNPGRNRQLHIMQRAGCYSWEIEVKYNDVDNNDDDSRFNQARDKREMII